MYQTQNLYIPIVKVFQDIITVITIMIAMLLQWDIDIQCNLIIMTCTMLATTNVDVLYW